MWLVEKDKGWLIVGFVTQIYIEANLFKYLKVTTKIIENIFHCIENNFKLHWKKCCYFSPSAGLEAMEFLSNVLVIGNIHNVIKWTTCQMETKEANKKGI